MLYLPLPLLTTLLCGVIAIQIWRRDTGIAEARYFFTALFMVSGIESLLVGLRFGYAISDFTPVQRSLPFFSGPLLYLGFACMALPANHVLRHAVLHLGGAAALVAASLVLLPLRIHLDWLIGASYMGYMLALFQLWRKGPDGLVNLRLEQAQLLHKWNILAAGFLFFILILDSLIALNFAYENGKNAASLISYATILIVIALAAIIFVMNTGKKAMQPNLEKQPDEPETAELEQKVRALLHDTRLYCDPELSVSRLAKRLRVPARSLSHAINHCQGVSVSVYVNSFRLEHAAELLRETETAIADVMTRSGFLTRSNFYRAFKEKYGITPSAYRTAGAAQEDQDCEG